MFNYLFIDKYVQRIAREVLIANYFSHSWHR
jgi:hypothetical protein